MAIINDKFGKRSDPEIIEQLMMRAKDAHPNVVAPGTQKTYQTLSARLKRLAASSGFSATIEGVIAYLASEHAAEKYAKTTFRLYKSAINFELVEQLKVAITENKGREKILARAIELNRIAETNFKSTSLLTSGQKSKFMPPEIIRSIKKAATKEKNTVAMNRLNAYIQANRLVGLRPIEWFDTEIIKDQSTRKLVLRVKNAKNSNERANGDYRGIVLDKITLDEVKHLVNYLHTIKLLKDAKAITDLKEFHKFNRALQLVLSRHLKSYFEHLEVSPTLYSVRHQVVADAKQSGMSETEIAAFFGHGSTKTAKRHYGTKNNGSGKPFKFRPLQESIDAVLMKQVSSGSEYIPSHVTDQALELFEFTQKGANSPENT